MGLLGIPILFIEDATFTIREQFRFPRSKKARIRKKWRKNQENWRMSPSPDVFRLDLEAGGMGLGFTFTGHPETIRRLRLRMNADLDLPAQVGVGMTLANQRSVDPFPSPL